ncbi:MAG TPA: ribonuclease III [Candidatus Copromorpha excrementigallinarum]|uniref:Ribonuclease 3 n=1 Tax=Candidatus Allocopromorpha excrementigallinarum TaxID=2840742 RepID=A0A9D1L6X2_9FIRM|nr:ribonuclease III [Candidatus Copromorpha excrementigallinarum]
MKDLRELEKSINYRFHDKRLLETSVTHSSYIKEQGKGEKSNERLEFLGDAFFDAIIGEELFKIFPQKEEGFLSRARAAIVCEKSLSRQARRLHIGEYIRLGRGEERNGGRHRESILADTMEAVIGAVYLDGGFEAVKKTVLGLFAESIEDARQGKFIVSDYKTTLQEKLQAEGITDIKYRLVGEKGPDHDKTFLVQLEVRGVPQTRGRGKSKKQAEQKAAEEMLERGKDVL